MVHNDIQLNLRWLNAFELNMGRANKMPKSHQQRTHAIEIECDKNSSFALYFKCGGAECVVHTVCPLSFTWQFIHTLEFTCARAGVLKLIVQFYKCLCRIVDRLLKLWGWAGLMKVRCGADDKIILFLLFRAQHSFEHVMWWLVAYSYAHTFSAKLFFFFLHKFYSNGSIENT